DDARGRQLRDFTMTEGAASGDAGTSPGITTTAATTLEDLLLFGPKSRRKTAAPASLSSLSTTHNSENQVCSPPLEANLQQHRTAMTVNEKMKGWLQSQ
ncbi:unnamed protein product, partial [Amoebophrya sp. A120]